MSDEPDFDAIEDPIERYRARAESTPEGRANRAIMREALRLWRNKDILLAEINEAYEKQETPK